MHMYIVHMYQYLMLGRYFKYKFKTIIICVNLRFYKDNFYSYFIYSFSHKFSIFILIFLICGIK